MTLKNCSVRTILLITLTVLPTWLIAGDNDYQHSAREQESTSEELVLRSIMRDLDENMREVAGAISREN
ncbi:MULTISPECIES: hypothetical protein [unclassified Salinivibrio]|uniref:hypothetical protein n=1 Tax=unclassified Salinivibrio TaxID=2636825 RepID=UPI000395B109|nr:MULTISPECIES: hypothetical protein [unclassified Salinivibrio]